MYHPARCGRADFQWRPLLVYGERGWAIERETYADEFLGRLDRLIADSDANAFADPGWLMERDLEALRLVLHRIEDSQAASAASGRIPVKQRRADERQEYLLGLRGAISNQVPFYGEGTMKYTKDNDCLSLE